MSLRSKTKRMILKLSGYVLPLVSSAPSAGGWVGLMAVPLLGFLIAMFSNGPTAIAEAVVFFTENPLNPMNPVIEVGAAISLISIGYLAYQKRRTTDFVASGPYRYIRHPQYLGFILLTAGLTAWSYWVLTHTFGVGWLSAEETVILWSGSHRICSSGAS